MNRPTGIVSGLLADSVAMNIGFLVRGAERSPEAAASFSVRKVPPPRMDPGGTEALRWAPPSSATEPAEASGPLSENAPSAAFPMLFSSQIDPRLARILDEAPFEVNR